MNNFEHISFRIDDKIMWVLIILYRLAFVAGSVKEKVVYTANAMPCISELIDNRDVLDRLEVWPGEIDCMRRCTRDAQCELAVYQELLDGSASCAKLSAARDDASSVLDVSSSRRCVAMRVYPCRNGGKLYEGVCICPDGFAGQACEKNNPDFCNSPWLLVATTFPDGKMSYGSYLTQDANHSNVKVMLYLHPNGLSVMKGMDIKFELTASIDRPYWPIITFPFFQKEQWNKFAKNAERQFIHFLLHKDLSLLIFNSSQKNYSVTDISVIFTYAIPGKTRYSILRKMPDDWTLFKADLENGHEVFGSTWENVDEDSKLVVSQIADRTLYKMAGGHFSLPPQMYVMKSVFGDKRYTARIRMSQGNMSETKTGPDVNVAYLNPCWTKMWDDKYDGRASLIGWKMLGTYLRLGHDVRVKVGGTYHTVIEVIQMGDSFHFVLAPFVTQGNATAFTDPLYGVKSIVSSAGVYTYCTHQIEGDKIVEQPTSKSQYNVTWFVDTRKWVKTFAVFSNSSVAYGSLSDLIAGVRSGSDVRIWIKSSVSNVSRFLDTHVSSVTYDNTKVSTESMITWPTSLDKAVPSRLNLICATQYLQVTSDGLLESLYFSALTPGRSNVHNDKLTITWFLA